MRLCCAVDFIVPNSHNMMVEAPSEIAKLKGECQVDAVKHVVCAP